MAQDDVIHVYAGQAIGSLVLNNDRDADGDLISVMSLGKPALGTASIATNGGMWIDYRAPEKVDDRTITGFSYTISDGRGGTSEAWCQVIIEPHPTQPLILLPSSDTGDSDDDGVTADNRPKLQLPVDAFITGQSVLLIVNGVLVGFDWVDVKQGIVQVRAPLPDGECQIAYGFSTWHGSFPSVISPVLTIQVDTGAEPPGPAPVLLPEFDDGGQGSALIIGQSARPVFDIGRLGTDETARLYVDGKLVSSSYNAQTGQLQMEQAFSPNLQNHACQDHQVAWTRVNQHGVESALSASTVVGVVASWRPERLDLLDRDDEGISNTDGLTRVNTPRFFVGHPPLPDGYSLGLMVDGQVVASQWDAASGLIQVSTPLSDGEHRIVVGAVKGNEFAPMLYEERLTIDTQGPVQFPLPPLRLDAASDLGYQGDNLTCINKPSMFHPELIVGGRGHASAQLFVDGVAVDSVWDKQKGTLTPVNPLTDGRHSFNFYVSDSAGNNSAKAWANLEVDIDTRVPDVIPPKPQLGAFSDSGPTWVASPAHSDYPRGWSDDNVTNSHSQLEFVVSPSNTSSAELVIDGQMVASMRSYWDLEGTRLSPLIDLQDGWHDVAVRYRSASGALSEASESLRILIDNTRPDAPTAAPSLRAIDDDGIRSDDGITSIKRPEFLFAAPPEGHFVSLWVDGVPVVSTLSADGSTVKPYYELSLGRHEVMITYSDLAGNESPLSKAISISIVEPVALNDLIQDTNLFAQADTSTQLEAAATLPGQSSLELLSFAAAEKVHVWRGVEDAVWLAA